MSNQTARTTRYSTRNLRKRPVVKQTSARRQNSGRFVEVIVYEMNECRCNVICTYKYLPCVAYKKMFILNCKRHDKTGNEYAGFLAVVTARLLSRINGLI